MRSTDSHRPGSIDADISREIVRIYNEFHGRGPTKAKTLRRDEIVVVVLDDIFGKSEQVLVDAGHFEQVRLNRQAIRDEIEPLFRAAIENATGRPVVACLGQVGEQGNACEIFLLGT